LEAVQLAEPPMKNITLSVDKERYRISYWDAAIVAAARALGARVLYSEDLNHGQDYVLRPG
jgi:predicted nucleic acid-binding protein